MPDSTPQNPDSTNWISIYIHINKALKLEVASVSVDKYGFIYIMTNMEHIFSWNSWNRNRKANAGPLIRGGGKLETYSNEGSTTALDL